MQEFLTRLWNEEEGQGMAEYGILIAGIAFAAIASTFVLGGRISNLYQEFTNRIW